jgi:hypothetical protein
MKIHQAQLYRPFFRMKDLPFEEMNLPPSEQANDVDVLLNVTLLDLYLQARSRSSFRIMISGKGGTIQI